MRFTVISPTRALPKVNQATWFLVQDSWDDYGFKTLYHLHFVTPDSSTNVGAVKILRQGQIDFDHTRIDEDFDALDHRYASVGQSLDYYEHLAAMGAVTRDTILTALNDIVKNPEDRSRFESEKGWRKSLFRDQESATISEFLALAGSLISGDYTSLPAEELKFSFQLTDWEKPVDFDFTKGVDSFEFLTISSNPLPDRVIALIGRNGSGKSTVLARLSRVAFGTAEQRSAGAFDNLGSIEPKGIGFPRIIAVSYSAFDSFALPGIAPRSVDSTDEREQIVQDVRRGEGRYIFCGLRDIASELKAKIQQSASIEEPLDRVHKTLLKSITELATEFGNTLSLIERRNRVDDLRAAFNIIATDPSVAFLGEEYILQKLVPEKAEAAFVEWSTGQKIVAQIVASLVAHISDRA